MARPNYGNTDYEVLRQGYKINKTILIFKGRLFSLHILVAFILVAKFQTISRNSFQIDYTQKSKDFATPNLKLHNHYCLMVKTFCFNDIHRYLPSFFYTFSRKDPGRVFNHLRLLT